MVSFLGFVLLSLILAGGAYLYWRVEQLSKKIDEQQGRAGADQTEGGKSSTPS